MKRILKRLIMPLWLSAMALLPHSAHAEYTVPSKMNSWYQDRFGMFIHFGSYSYYGSGEWEMFEGWWSKANYQTQISANFNPTSFDANAIVTLAKNAGMKYIVITAKHHEGFAMWNTNVASFKDHTGTISYDLFDYAGFNRDVLGELKAACDAQGIKFCLYYSIIDWNHSSQVMTSGPTYPYDYFTQIQGSNNGPSSWKNVKAAYVADMKAQLAELINTYHPAVLWFDGDWCRDLQNPDRNDWWNAADGQDLYNYCVGLDPNLIVNERVKRDTGKGDYAVAEFGIPSAPMERAWERCETMNGMWGYDQAFENNYFSTTEMIQKMITVVSRDGNYLLNIGPKGDGSVTNGSINVLQGIGNWMDTYSDSIYGTVGSPFSSEPFWGKYTMKDGKLFAHVFTWPTDGQLVVPGVTNSISRVYSMANPSVNLSYTTVDNAIQISVPASAPNASASVIAIEMSGMPQADPNYSPGGAIADGTYTITPTHSGKPIVVEQGSINNGAYVIQWPDNGNPEFQWNVTAVGGGFYKIINAKSGKALGIEGVSTANGARALQWDYVGNTDQQWQIIAAGGGAYSLIAGHSGKALDINGASTADGAWAIQWDYSGVPNQLFSFASVGGPGPSNNPPAFTNDPFSASNATANAAYSGSIAGSATDPDNGDTLTYSKISGPAWLSIAGNGALSGTPGSGDVGANSFTVRVSDGTDTDTATLNITVDPPAPTVDSYVSNIAMSSASYGGGRYSGIATITVRGVGGSPVANAAVSVTWSGAAPGSASATTNGSGVVVFESGKVKNGGNFTVTVNNVTASGYSYNAALNVETSDSITAP